MIMYGYVWFCMVSDSCSLKIRKISLPEMFLSKWPLVPKSAGFSSGSKAFCSACVCSSSKGPANLEVLAQFGP